MDESLFTKGFSRTMILLDDIVNLTDGGRDQSSISIYTHKGIKEGQTEKARMLECTNA